MKHPAEVGSLRSVKTKQFLNSEIHPQYISILYDYMSNLVVPLKECSQREFFTNCLARLLLMKPLSVSLCRFVFLCFFALSRGWDVFS